MEVKCPLDVHVELILLSGLGEKIEKRILSQKLDHFNISNLRLSASKRHMHNIRHPEISQSMRIYHQVANFSTISITANIL